MAKVNLKPEDRKKEIEEAKEQKVVNKYGQQIGSQYAGKKEKPVSEPSEGGAR